MDMARSATGWKRDTGQARVLQLDEWNGQNQYSFVPDYGDPFVVGGLSVLDERERTVVLSYYWDGITFREIGQRIGLTEGRAWQVHGEAIAKLRIYFAE